MPFDGKPSTLPGNLAPGSFNGEAHATSLFGLDGGEWRGFFFALTGIFSLILGMAAVLMEIAGP